MLVRPTTLRLVIWLADAGPQSSRAGVSPQCRCWLLCVLSRLAAVRPRHLPLHWVGQLAGRLASDRWPSSPPRLYSTIRSPFWRGLSPSLPSAPPPTSSLASCSSCCSCSLPPRRRSRAGCRRSSLCGIVDLHLSQCYIMASYCKRESLANRRSITDVMLPEKVGSSRLTDRLGLIC